MSFWFQASSLPGAAFSYLFSTAEEFSNDTFAPDQLQIYLPQASLTKSLVLMSSSSCTLIMTAECSRAFV